MSGPTPGPWRAVASKFSHDFGILDSTGKNVIAECFSDIRYSGERALREAASNAYLIAAARDLKEALQPFVAHNSSEEFVTVRLRSEDIALARQAIAKSEGAL